MEITLLFDADMDGAAKYFKTGLEELGWDQDLAIWFKRLRDFGMSNDTPDWEVWRFAQQRGFWLVTNNRNSDNEGSLQATMKRENTPQSLPVIITSDKDRLSESEYRRKAMIRLVEILIYPETSVGAGRLFIP